ncbi:MAG: H-X9-DG-CTERM domain-containing protein [Verrucomicrobiota bacterium]
MTAQGFKDIVPGAEDDAGFNRILQDDYGGCRHNGKANYVFADGHTGLYNANDLRRDEVECWWSLQLDAHAQGLAPAFRAEGSAP